MDRKIKILVITYLPWRNDTSVGNSYSNIFNGMADSFEFAHIYFRDGMPDNTLVHKYFHISEKEMMKSIFNRKPVGRSFYLKDPSNSPKVQFSKKYNAMRKLRWESFLLARDMIGRFGKWKSQALLDFVSDFDPDLIFGTLGYVPVVNEIMIYLKKYLNIPLVTYPWDDYYSLKRISFSPMFWIRNLSERGLIKRCAQESSYLYTITEKMQKEYTEYFKKECRLLYKGYNFDKRDNKQQVCSSPIEMVYMGNIGSGRWKVLGEIAKAISNINKGTSKFRLRVYTLSPVDKKIKNALNVSGASKLMKPVADADVINVMKSADILVHVEPTTLKDRLFYRLSFSTKIVDYFYCGKCIFAAGGRTAAMDYLKDNDAAIVELDKKNFTNVLNEIATDPELITKYGDKAWMCGKKNHDIHKIQSRIYSDFINLVENDHAYKIKKQ